MSQRDLQVMGSPPTKTRILFAQDKSSWVRMKLLVTWIVKGECEL